jgi:hypothetical protein
LVPLKKDEISPSKENIQKLNPKLIGRFGTMNAESKPTRKQYSDDDNISSVKARIRRFHNLI